jgi:hypothetical protein
MNFWTCDRNVVDLKGTVLLTRISQVSSPLCRRIAQTRLQETSQWLLSIPPPAEPQDPGAAADPPCFAKAVPQPP